ncbi:MAG: 2-amino-4-hydroxy-6-hydroxymethyldihydropteridine diphosphokinase [Woeseiaceae bacterium]
MARVYLGLGSNIDPEKNLRFAVRELRARYGSLDLSSVYRNAPVGFEGADFLNMVAGFDSGDDAAAVQVQIERIHDRAGRDQCRGRFTSRPLDIDLLLYGDLVSDCPRLPRSDVLDYSFVLKPLSELDPGFIHPVTGRRLDEHWRAVQAASHPLEPVDVIL